MLDGIKLILNNCYFSFNNEIFHQTYGSPMGSPISPVLAELVLEHLEQMVLEQLRSKGIHLKVFQRYVDDILAVASMRQIPHILRKFNEIHPRINFTLEEEVNGQIPFLDVLVIRSNSGELKTDWYHKATWSGRYLNYHSYLPFSYKLNTITVLAKKVLELVSSEFHSKNFELIRNVLFNNGYPRSLIDKTMANIIQKHSTTSLSSPPTNQVTTENTCFISLPYDKVVFNKLRYILKPHNIKAVGKASKTVGQMFYSLLKDRIPKEKVSEVCYEITCECDLKYIGQTKQHLLKRFQQHKNGDIGHSALSEHLISQNHKISFENCRVLCNEATQAKRDVKEMIYIRCSNVMNSHTDSHKLGRTYDNLLKGNHT